MISVTGGRIKHRKGRWSANWRIFSTQTWPVPTGDCGPSSSNMLSKWRLFETLQKPRKRWGLGRKEGGKGGGNEGRNGGARGALFPERRMTAGVPTFLNTVTNTFFTYSTFPHERPQLQTQGGIKHRGAPNLFLVPGAVRCWVGVIKMQRRIQFCRRCAAISSRNFATPSWPRRCTSKRRHSGCLPPPPNRMRRSRER